MIFVMPMTRAETMPNIEGVDFLQVFDKKVLPEKKMVHSVTFWPVKKSPKKLLIYLLAHLLLHI